MVEETAVFEADADPTEAAEETRTRTPILEIIILLQTSPTKIKAKEAKRLIKKAPKPALMFQITPVLAIGRKAVLRLIVRILSSVPGSTSSPLVKEPEELASLALKILK